MKNSTNNQKFFAGVETARADFRRGMDEAAMLRVPQPQDHPAWADGYRSETEHLWLQEKLWS